MFHMISSDWETIFFQSTVECIFFLNANVDIWLLSVDLLSAFWGENKVEKVSQSSSEDNYSLTVTMWSQSVTDDWLMNWILIWSKLEALNWFGWCCPLLMNTHSSVRNLITLLLLERSPKQVDLLLAEGNEGTVGRRLGSKDPHSPVFPRSGPICLPRCHSPYFLAPLWFIAFLVLEVSKWFQKATWISNLSLEIFLKIFLMLVKKMHSTLQLEFKDS